MLLPKITSLVAAFLALGLISGACAEGLGNKSPNQEWAITAKDPSTLVIKNKTREFTLVASKLTSQFVKADQILCAWSDDSRFLSVTVYHNRISDLYMVDLTGQEPKIVIVEPLEKAFLDQHVRNRKWERIDRQSPIGQKWEGGKLLVKESGFCISGTELRMYRAVYSISFDGGKIIRSIEDLD